MKQAFASVAFLVFLLLNNSVTPGAASPAPPTNVHSVSGEGYIKISWEASSEPGVTGYRVYRRTTATSYSKADSFSSREAAFKDTKVQDGRTYVYAVAAVDAQGNESALSVETMETCRSILLAKYLDKKNKKSLPFPARVQNAAVGDLNGDGKPDLVLGMPASSKVVIIFDAMNGRTPDVTLTGSTQKDRFGHSLAVADLNNDGYDDLIVGAPDFSANPHRKNIRTGRGYVFAGGRQFSTTPALTLNGEEVSHTQETEMHGPLSKLDSPAPFTGEQMGASVAAVGDVNGDGYPDVAMGAPMGGVDQGGRLVILLGGTSFDGQRVDIRGPAPSGHLGRSLGAAGDVNGDGFADIIAGGTRCKEKGCRQGEARLIYGGSVIQLSDLVLSGAGGFGSTVFGLDFNGDGFSDMAIGRGKKKVMDMFSGGPSPHVRPSASFPGSETLFPLGDINGDGFEDFVSAGLAVHLGNSFHDNTPDILRDMGEVIGTGDLDGDSIPEIIAYCGPMSSSSKSAQSGPFEVCAYSLSTYAKLPQIHLTTLKNHSTILSPSVDIEGIVQGDVSKIRVAGREVQTSADGRFLHRADLALGSNTIEIIAETSGGAVSKRVLQLTHASHVVPSLAVAITLPEEGAVLQTNPVMVAGTVSDSSARVTVNGLEASVSGQTFEAGIHLLPGQNTITASAADTHGQTAEDAVTVEFTPTPGPSPPTVTLTATPPNILSGEWTELSWDSTGATHCSIEPEIGIVAHSGSMKISPGATTHYTITATGEGGTSTATVTVVVGHSAPTATFSAGPETIEAGQTAVLSWSSADADSIHIEPGIGAAQLSGSLQVSPAETTTYTLTATGLGGTITASVTVVVLPAPSQTATLTGVVTEAQSGLPLEGATVTVIDAGQTQSTVTDVDGAYVLSQIALGEVGIRAVHGHLSEELSLVLSEPVTYEHNFSLQGPSTATSLTGKVTDGTTGLPLAGATVTVTDSAGTHSVQTLADGTYEAPGLTPGAIQITIAHEGYASQTFTTTLEAAQVYEYDFALLSATASAVVHGTITNSKTLLPEPGVSISLQGTDNLDVTGQDGSFTLFHVPLGAQFFRLFKEDFVDGSVRIEVDRNPFPLDLVLPLAVGVPHPAVIGRDVTGFVHDAMTGGALAGATIKVAGKEIETTTDADGRYTLVNLPTGKIQIIAMALDYEALSLNPTVAEGVSEEFSFHLSPTTRGLITGKITDGQSGEPLRYANVEVEGGGLLTASTEADGSFRLVGVPAGVHNLVVIHAEYIPQRMDEVVVADMSPTNLDVSLERRPETGSIRGTLRDKGTHGVIAGAVLTDKDTGAVAVTDAAGQYQLSGLPAGLVTLTLEAEGYPVSTRTTRVFADQDASSPTVTPADFSLDALDPSPPESVSKMISAQAGGLIESPDGRFSLVIPPGALSADAILTLMNPTTGPSVSPGDELRIDPELEINGIRAVGQMTQLVIEPAVQGEAIPGLSGWVVVLGQYSQAQVEASQVSENSIFPYYWDGMHWTAMEMKPLEVGVDPIHNISWAALNLNATMNGRPLAARTGPRKPILLASLSGHVPYYGAAKIFVFVWAGILRDLVFHPPTNVTLYDQDQLDAVTANTDPLKEPNPNALPLLVIHGWDPKQILTDSPGTDPNGPGRYKTILEDIVENSNGVYRPVFVSHNSRASMMDIGKEVAAIFHGNYLNQPSRIKGIPGDPEDPESGNFPYITTFGFSMGGLVTRAYQSFGGAARNMVIAGTPNHGTLGIISYLKSESLLPGWVPLGLLALHSPGTADLLAYDDRLPCRLSGNSRLCELNRNARALPEKEITLIAGTSGNQWTDLYFREPNDIIVPVSSVFCQTSNPHDGIKSLFPEQKIGLRGLYEFNHLIFGGDKYRIGAKENDLLKRDIFRGFPDWVVSKQEDDLKTHFDDNEVIYPNTSTDGYVRSRVRVEYNCHGGDTDRVVLVVYVMDGNSKWRILEGDNGAHSDGSINLEKVLFVNQNSSYPEKEQEHLTAYGILPKVDHSNASTHVNDVDVQIINLKPGQFRVPTEPDKAGFSTP